MWKEAKSFFFSPLSPAVSKMRINFVTLIFWAVKSTMKVILLGKKYFAKCSIKQFNYYTTQLFFYSHKSNFFLLRIQFFWEDGCWGLTERWIEGPQRERKGLFSWYCTSSSTAGSRSSLPFQTLCQTFKLDWKSFAIKKYYCAELCTNFLLPSPTEVSNQSVLGDQFLLFNFNCFEIVEIRFLLIFCNPKEKEGVLRQT